MIISYLNIIDNRLMIHVALYDNTDHYNGTDLS